MELLPCPFCGGTSSAVKSDRTGRVFAVECPDCFAAGPMRMDRGLAAATWNSRTFGKVENVSSEIVASIAPLRG